MAGSRRRKIASLLCGILIGLLVSSLSKRDVDLCQVPKEPNTTATKNERLLFVGVMTAAKYLDTRAKAVHETWGLQVPGKLLFFTSERSKVDPSMLHVVVPLIGVDDSYPPQKKSFSMLKYMYDKHLEDYEWFMRADDDVYVRTDKLETLLRSVDSSKPWFIGQTGRGNSEEFGLLSLENDENFCMGGPGIIFSRETLRRLGPHVEECLADMYTTHEDVELGRCVKKSAGVSCTWSYEASDFTYNFYSQMQVILYHNQSGDAAFSGNLKQREVHRAITLHPIKKPEYMYRLHYYLQGLGVRYRRQQRVQLLRDIAVSLGHLDESYRYLLDNISEDRKGLLQKNDTQSYLGESNILGKSATLNRFRARTVDEILDWEFISKSIYSYKDLNPKRRYGSAVKEGLTDVVREIMEIMNQFSKQRGRIIDYKEIYYGYYRLDPIHGVDYILDLLLVYRKYRGHKMTVPVRRHAYIQQTFTGVQIRETEQSHATQPYLNHKILKNVFSKLESNFIFKQGYKYLITKNGHNVPVNFILPLSGRHDTFRRFMANFAKFHNDENINLFVILYEEPDSFLENLSLLQSYKKDGLNVEWTVQKESFSRGKALQYGVQSLQDDDLMFFMDVDIVFEKDFLQRVRSNTVRNKSLYFPIVFSLYSDKLGNASRQSVEDFAEDAGCWRQFGFGLVAIYKSDFVALGGFNTSISGWGYEDVNFFEKSVKALANPAMKIVRCVDVGLVHVYHPVVCDLGLDPVQVNMCKGTQASMLGSLEKLQDYYYKNERQDRSV